MKLALVVTSIALLGSHPATAAVQRHLITFSEGKSYFLYEGVAERVVGDLSGDQRRAVTATGDAAFADGHHQWRTTAARLYVYRLPIGPDSGVDRDEDGNPTIPATGRCAFLIGPTVVLSLPGRFLVCKR